MNYAAWEKDRKTIDAVIRNCKIIGEAATNVPDEIQRKYLEIPWAKMKGIRNILIHEYFGVDIEVIWETIQKDLGPLKQQLEKIED